MERGRQGSMTAAVREREVGRGVAGGRVMMDDINNIIYWMWVREMELSSDLN